MKNHLFALYGFRNVLIFGALVLSLTGILKSFFIYIIFLNRATLYSFATPRGE